MWRDLSSLEAEKFDVLVIGGGIYGAFIVRDAVYRGFKVCLIEAEDFGSGTSHNSLKIIHGGIRYFQHLNFKRVFDSIREREIWANIAPNYVKPLKFVIPAYGYSTRGPVALTAAVTMHNAFNLAQNGKATSRKYPHGKVLSSKECQELVPYLEGKSITGGVYWYDGQVIDADRLIIKILKDSERQGITLANYVRANKILSCNNKVEGVHAIDQITGQEFKITSSIVVNATGPWAYQTLQTNKNFNSNSYKNLPLSKSFNIVIDSIGKDHAFGLESGRSSDAVIGKSNRAYFFTPWLNTTVIGTAHFSHNNSNNLNSDVSKEIGGYIDEINQICPTLNLTTKSIKYVYSGFTPADDAIGKGEASRSHRSDIIDHEHKDGIKNLISVIGVKYTTSRLVAEKVVDLISLKLNKNVNGELSRTKSIGKEFDDELNVIDKYILTPLPDRDDVYQTFNNHIKKSCFIVN